MRAGLTADGALADRAGFARTAASAAQAPADLDVAWKQPGAIQPDIFVALVYNSLERIPAPSF